MASASASASIAGRVFSSRGTGLFGALVTLTDQNGVSRYARTNMFGYYRFENVETGQTYVIKSAYKRFKFAPQAISVNDDLSELNFYSLK